MPRTLEEILGQSGTIQSPVAQPTQQSDGPGFFGALAQGYRESPTGMIQYGLPQPSTEDYDFWEKVAKGLGANLDPISLGLFFAGGGIGGAVAKKIGVQAAIKIATKAGAKQAVRGAMNTIAARGITGAAQFGLQSAGAEGIRQAVAKDLDVAKLLREAGKGALTGAAVGPAAAVPGKGLVGSLPRLAAETTALTGAGAVLSGEKINPEDFLVNAAVLGASKAVARPFENAARKAGEKILADDLKRQSARGEGEYKELRPGTPAPPPGLDPSQRPSLARPNPAGEVARPEGLVPGATPIGELTPTQKSALWAEAKAAREARRAKLPKPPEPGPLRKIIEYEPAKGFGESMGEWFARKYVDESSPLRKFDAKIEELTGKPLAAHISPFYMTRTRFADVMPRAMRKIETDFDPITRGMEPKELTRLGEHVVARAIDAQRGTHPEAMQDLMRANGLDDSSIHTLLRTGAEEIASNGKSMEQMAGEISDFNWRLAVETMGRQKAEELWGRKGFYAPLFRERQATDLDMLVSPERMLEAQFGVAPGERPLTDPLRRLEGTGVRKLADPFGSIFAQTAGLMRYAEHQRVGRAIKDLADMYDMPELAQRVNGPGPGVIEVSVNYTPKHLSKARFPGSLGTEPIHYYKVDPLVFHAYANMGKGARGIANKFLTAPTKILRAGATLAPEFWIRNAFRDVFSAMVYSKNGFTPADFVRGMLEAANKGEYWQKWVESGGAAASFASMDKNYLIRRHVEYLKTGKKAELSRIIRHPLDAMRMMSSLVEDATRIGEFRKAKLKGKSDTQAAFESRDLTIDFARMGETGRSVNQLVAFWNAQISGYEKLYRELGKQWVTDPKRAAAVTGRAVSLITIPSAALLLNNIRDPRWKDIPDWQKNAFWIVMWPGSKNIWRIPKPFDLGVVFASPVERALEAMLKDDPSQWGKLMEAFGSTASDVLPGSPSDITALGPLFDVARNKAGYTGSRIVPRRVEDWPAGLQTKNWTSRTARSMGEALGYSPAKIEYLWNGYTASLGRYASDASDTALNILDPKDAPKRPAEGIPFAGVPILRNIMRSFSVRTGGGQVFDDYSDLLGKNEEKWRARKDPRMRMSPREAREVERIHRVGLAYDKQINTSWKRIDQIELSKSLTPDEKRVKIDAEYYKIARIAEKAMGKIGRR